MDIKIPLTRPYFDQEELEELKDVFDSGWVSQGPKVKEFEDLSSKYLGIKNSIAVSNCTSALHLALLSLGINKEDEVIVADFTFPATGHAVLYCGAKPVFVDADFQTYNIDPSLIEEKIPDKTKAIIPVHTFGQSAEMKKILEIAKKNNLYVIEDAACAFGAKYKTKFAGTIGDIGCYSFHGRKGITTGEGGMIVTKDNKMAERIRFLSVFGMTTAWSREKSKKTLIPKFTELGYNYKMSDITAAVGIGQLRKIEEIIKRKRNLAKYWDESIENIECITPPFVSKKVFHIYQSYVAVIDKKINRDKLIEKLRNEGIQTQIGTYSSHIQPIYNCDYTCENSIKLFNQTLSLPLFYELKEENIDYVVSNLKTMLR